MNIIEAIEDPSIIGDALSPAQTTYLRALYGLALRVVSVSIRWRPGERGWCVVIAATKRQASVVFGYILARLEDSPTLRRMISDEPRQDEIDLANGISIGVWPCSYRSIRGLSIVCCVARGRDGGSTRWKASANGSKLNCLTEARGALSSLELDTSRFSLKSPDIEGCVHVFAFAQVAAERECVRSMCLSVFVFPLRWTPD